MLIRTFIVCVYVRACCVLWVSERRERGTEPVLCMSLSDGNQRQEYAMLIRTLIVCVCVRVRVGVYACVYVICVCVCVYVYRSRKR